MSDNSDRSRGVLSPADRRFLKNADEYSRQAAHERKKAIHERAADSTLDYPLLAEFVDYDRVLENVDGGLVEALKSQVAFVYQLADATDLLDADTLVKEAVEEARTSRLDVIAQRARDDPGSVTLGEVRDLAEAGLIDSEVHNEFFRREIRPPIGNVNPEEGTGDRTLEEWLADEVEKREEQMRGDASNEQAHLDMLDEELADGE